MIRVANTILLALLLGGAASACNIPVFRYALERWQPDQCEIVVFHAGPLTAQQRGLLANLDPKADPDGRVHVRISYANVSSTPAEHQELWNAMEAQADASLPYAVVRSKVGAGRIVNAWHGPLDSMAKARIVDSPARKELGRRLLAGDAIVWLLIGSHDETQNQKARQLLTDRLPLLANKIELPEGIGLPGSELHSEIPLLLRFSLLEIDRGDEREQFLVQLFSGFQPEAVAKGQPLIVPVFGRGRALEVIPAGVLSERLLEDLTLFLSGACSCQVKEQNPGFDLLLSVDWNTELFGEDAVPPPERTTRDRERPVLLSIPPGNSTPAALLNGNAPGP